MTAEDAVQHLTLAARTESPHPGADQSVPEVGRLVEAFLDIVIKIARSQDQAELNLLDAFRNKHADFIRAQHEEFFLVLVQAIKQRFRFGKKQPDTDIHVTNFGMGVPKFPLCFISQACRLVLLDALPEGEYIPDGETDKKLRLYSDETLASYITTFQEYDSPWLFFTTLYVAGMRELPVWYTRQS